MLLHCFIQSTVKNFTKKECLFEFLYLSTYRNFTFKRRKMKIIEQSVMNFLYVEPLLVIVYNLSNHSRSLLLRALENTVTRSRSHSLQAIGSDRRVPCIKSSMGIQIPSLWLRPLEIMGPCKTSRRRSTCGPGHC